MAPPTSRFVLLDRRTLSISIALILAVAFAAPALADYLGPDRVTTEFQLVHVPEKDVWTLTHVDPDDGFADVCLIIHPCSEHPSVERQNDLCGWTADNSGCSEWWEEQEVTVTYPEATIAAELQNCDLVDGWCTSSPTLNLTGSEPVAGETITLIEGTRNGEAFACEGASCGVPLLEGQNDFTFWAHSSWGDTSQMGTFSAKVDSQGPSIGIPDEWTIWEPLAIAVDDARGVELIELTVKGGEYGNRTYQWNLANLPGDWIWDRYFGEIVAPIGEYPVTVEAWDVLGNGSTAHGTIVIPPPDEPEEESSAALLEAESDSESETSESVGETSGGTDGSGAEITESEPAAEPSSGASEDPSDEAPSSSADPETNDPSAAASALTTSDQEAQATVPPSGGGSGVLWGAAAAAAIGAASAYGLSRKQKREVAIEAKRKELAERRSARSFADHLQSLRQAAEARVAPIRAAMIAAGAAAAKAAQEVQARGKVLARLAPSAAQSPTDLAHGVSWQTHDPDLSATYRLGQIYSSPNLSSELGPPGGIGTPTPPTGGPDATSTPTPPGVADQPTPAPAPRAPLPAGYIPNDPDLFALEGRWIARGGRIISSGVKASLASAIQYSPLETGLISVSAPSYAPGTRAEFLADYGLRGARYRPTTITRITGSTMVRRVFGKFSLGVGLGTSIIGNVWDYTVGSQRGTGIVSREFAVSTGVDFAMAVGVGLASAAIVAGGALALGVTVTASAGVIAAAVVGLVIGLILDAVGVGPELKRRVNDGFDALPGIIHNGQIIAEYVGDRATEAVQGAVSTVSNVASNMGRTAGEAASEAAESVRAVAQEAVTDARDLMSNIGNAATEAADGAREFIRKLFGGGD